MDKLKVGVVLSMGVGDGWGRVDWWGGNGENCTWTIKKELKIEKEKINVGVF